MPNVPRSFPTQASQVHVKFAARAKWATGSGSTLEAGAPIATPV
jgi:hypothetical protein